MLPVSFTALTLCALAGALAYVAVSRGAPKSALWLLLLVVLPWLPLPAALQLWSGRLVILVWIAVASALAVPFVYGLTLPRRPAFLAGVLAFLIGLVSWWQVAPQVPGGDEPHYLIITQSLLQDRDLAIENNHRQRDYQSYFAGELPPDYRVRGRDREIYSIHAPGVSALVAPAFAVAGYYGAGLLLLVLSAWGASLMWGLANRATGREDAAWFGWAAVTLSSTWIFHSFTIYPDGPGAVLTLTGVWALLRIDEEVENRSESLKPWFWHGVALALLPWMHSRFAVLAGGIGALVLLRMAAVPNAAFKMFAFLAIPSVSCLAWLAYFIAIYGTPDPSAPYGGEEGSFAFLPDGLAGLLFDQRFGLFAYAPALLATVAGLGVMLARPAWRRHALELLFVVVPYLLVVTYIAMWWGGRSAPARFLVPVLPWLAIPAAAAWTAIERRATRIVALGSLVFTAFASAVLVFAAEGALAFNTRETYALWLEWLNGTIDLGRALPVWWRDEETPLFRGILVWGMAAAGAWYLLDRTIRTRRVPLVPSIVIATALFAAAASVASAITWLAEGVSGRVTTPSQLDALRTVSAERQLVAVRLPSLARVPRDGIAAALSIAPDRATGTGGAGRNDRPLYILPAMPAGEYRVTPRMNGQDGWVMIGIGRDQFAIHTETLEVASRGITVRLPVDVRALIVRGDEDARRTVIGLDVQPVRLVLPEDRLTEEYAKHAVRYADTTTFFLDEHSYPEPEAFWVKGESASEVVIHQDSPHPAETLLIRNGAADNTVLVSTGGWREEMRLGPGEERRVQVPADHARGATLVRISTTAGFRPSDVDPQNRDTRYLGAWIRVGG